MPARSAAPVARRWLPFLGRRLGIARDLSSLTVDPDDLDLHHIFPTATSLDRLLGHPGTFEPRAGGSGVTAREAVDRAMGELLERYAALAFDGSDRIVASHDRLARDGHRVVPFANLAMFTPEQCAAAGFGYAEFTRDAPIGWIEGTDLTDGTPAQVPAQLVALGHVAGTDEAGRYFYASSSGCALATSIEGAVLSALLELIERDAVMVRWYARLAPPRLELDPAAVLGLPLARQQRALGLRFHDLTVDGTVPVVGVTCTEFSGRACCFLLSAAAGLDTAGAARKALLEAGQGRPFVKFLANAQGAPRPGDRFGDFDSNVRFFAEPSNFHYAAWLLGNPAVSDRHTPALHGTDGPAARLALLLARCRGMGVTPIAFDMTTPDLRDGGLFACRVYAPELVPLAIPAAPFLGHPRLARFIARARAAGAPSVPDWLPHPFP